MRIGRKNEDKQKGGDHGVSVPVQSGFKVHATNKNHRYGVSIKSKSLRKTVQIRIFNTRVPEKYPSKRHLE